MKVVGGKTARIVAGQVVRDITTEDLERLPAESELLKKYQVSRPSLREGLRLLEMHGVITLRPGPGGGAVVNPVASEQFAASSSLYFHLLNLTLRDLLKTRLNVEPLMSRLAAERVKAGIPWTPEGSPDDQPNRRNFHYSVAKFADDPILLLFADALRDIAVDISAGEKNTKVSGENISITHTQIEKAIAAGSQVKAEKLMRAHLEEYVGLLETHAPHLLNQVIDWG